MIGSQRMPRAASVAYALASEMGVTLDTKWGGAKLLFGGEGGFVVHCTGQGKVEVISGLADGQLVVLADRRLPVPGGIGQYAPPSQASPEPTARR